MAIIAAAAAGRTTAAGVVIEITGRKNDPLEGIAVYLVPANGAAEAARTSIPSAAVMAQADHAFIPHLLVVETGAQVSFPNNDTVSHHVYSFSDAKSFELDLYRGNSHPPQLFDVPGLVVLGCNIHDGMLGYILVVDTPFFSVTDAAGRAAIPDVDAGSYELRIWTPRAPADALPDPRVISIGEHATNEISVRIHGRLRPPHDAHAGSLSWTAY